MKTLFSLNKGVDGKRIRLTTDIERDARMILPVKDTGVKIAVPYSVDLSCAYRRGKAVPIFSIGDVWFTPVYKTSRHEEPCALRADRPLPASWLVDLTGVDCGEADA